MKKEVKIEAVDAYGMPETVKPTAQIPYHLGQLKLKLNSILEGCEALGEKLDGYIPEHTHKDPEVLSLTGKTGTLKEIMQMENQATIIDDFIKRVLENNDL